jgi:hypothetical protein
MLGSLLIGCATWVEVDGITAVKSIGVEAELPAGWMRQRYLSDEIVITRDGVGLEYIHIRRTGIDEEIPNINRKLRAGMLPQQAAELRLDSTRLAEDVTNLDVIENAPAEIDGRECYKLSYAYRVGSGLKMRAIEYGCLIGEYHYRIEYRAAAQHYFDAYLDVFERVRRSVRFVS